MTAAKKVKPCGRSSAHRAPSCSFCRNIHRPEPHRAGLRQAQAPAAQSHRANCRVRRGRNQLLPAFVPKECANYFKKAGYAATQIHPALASHPPAETSNISGIAASGAKRAAAELSYPLTATSVARRPQVVIEPPPGFMRRCRIKLPWLWLHGWQSHPSRPVTGSQRALARVP